MSSHRYRFLQKCEKLWMDKQQQFFVVLNCLSFLSFTGLTHLLQKEVKVKLSVIKQDYFILTASLWSAHSLQSIQIWNTNNCKCQVWEAVSAGANWCAVKQQLQGFFLWCTSPLNCAFVAFAGKSCYTVWSGPLVNKGQELFPICLRSSSRPYLPFKLWVNCHLHLNF